MLDFLGGEFASLVLRDVSIGEEQLSVEFNN